jgi:transglutaminase-like putative cysteine protease
LTTLDLGRGTCCNFAFLMIDALRQLGIAARFVSGNLYDASLDDDVGPVASGMTMSPS